jgi:D-glycero-D-manno-heptose 1,7-bisphosphate phosphatase
MTGRRAAFLDRDGTIVQERHYLADPNAVELVPGTIAALRTLAAHGFVLVIVTNQSGIARGLYSEADFRAVQRRLESLLAAAGVVFDAVYHCPHHPEHTGPCQCRKPDLGMYDAAVADLGVDPSISIFVGDRIKDVLPARALGGRGFLVRTGYGAMEEEALPAGMETAADLAEVARIVTGAAG